MLELFLKGGWIMYPLLACSLLVVAVSLERAIYFLRIRNDDDRLIDGTREILRNGKIQECGALCRDSKGPVARAVDVCIRNITKGPEKIETVIEHEGSGILAQMEKRLRILAVVGQSAPLMGLLGTVIGMIKAFMEIETAGGRVNATALAGGIWEALLTTAFGLCVAIPAVLMYHYFEGRVDDYEKKIHRIVHEIIDISEDLRDNEIPQTEKS